MMSDMKQTMGSAFAGLFIGIGILGGGYFAASAFKDVKLANQMLTVKGFAEKDVISDYAKWTGSFRETALTKQDVYKNLLLTKDIVTASLQSKGLKGKDISYGQVFIYSVYKRDDKGINTNEIEKYDGTLQVNFESADIALVARIAKESESLIQEGVNFESQPPQYLFSKLDDLKIQLLGEAAKDAKERASELSSKVGGKIGALRNAKQGVFQITSRNDTSVSGYGMYDTSSVNKTVKAVVTMSFAAS